MSSIEKPRVRLGPSTGHWWGLTRGSIDCDNIGEGLCERSNKELSDWLVEETSWQPSKCSKWCLFASLWVKRCVFKFDLWLKLLLQTGHLWGDSSMCKILCTASVLDWQNPFPHSVHLKGFSFECMYLKNRKQNRDSSWTFTSREFVHYENVRIHLYSLTSDEIIAFNEYWSHSTLWAH